MKLVLEPLSITRLSNASQIAQSIRLITRRGLLGKTVQAALEKPCNFCRRCAGLRMLFSPIARRGGDTHLDLLPAGGERPAELEAMMTCEECHSSAA